MKELKLDEMHRLGSVCEALQGHDGEREKREELSVPSGAEVVL